MMADRGANRAGAACAIVGSILLLLGTLLHPMEADPAHAEAAFREYAADRLWVASHLAQLAGVAVIVAALLILSRQLSSSSPAILPVLAGAGATAGLSLAAALQAVDGIALKTMVDAWAAAPPARKDMVFHAAFAVRQIEVGLAAMLSLVLGLTATLYGIALLRDRTYPGWLAALAIAAGLPTMVSGLVMAHAGFSRLAMAINMPANSLLLIWTLALGVLMGRTRG